jgi:hypothetical protein
MPLQLRDKSYFIPKLTPIANIFRLNLFNTYSLSSQSVGASAQIQTLGHLPPKIESSMAGQNQAVHVNFIPKLHSALPFLIFTSDSPPAFS